MKFEMGYEPIPDNGDKLSPKGVDPDKLLEEIMDEIERLQVRINALNNINKDGKSYSIFFDNRDNRYFVGLEYHYIKSAPERKMPSVEGRQGDIYA